VVYVAIPEVFQSTVVTYSERERARATREEKSVSLLFDVSVLGQQERHIPTQTSFQGSGRIYPPPKPYQYGPTPRSFQDYQEP
jgi:hypothetical protein